MNKTINDVLRNMPEDPYAFFIGEFQKVTYKIMQLASPSVEIVDLDAV